jgi:hypothetical protein
MGPLVGGHRRGRLRVTLVVAGGLGPLDQAEHDQRPQPAGQPAEGPCPHPGRAALFVVVSSGADPDRAIDALQPLGPRVLRTTLDPAVEQRLLAAFTEPAPQPGSTSPSPPASE